MHRATDSIPDTPEDAVRITDGIRRGDRAAFSLFYSLVAGSIFDATKAFTHRDEQFCLDVVQETLMRAISSIPSLSTIHSLHAWTHRTARTVALDMLRKEWRGLARERRVAAGRSETSCEPRTTDHGTHDELAWLVQQLSVLDPATEHWLRQHMGEGTTLASLARHHADGVGAGAPSITRDAIYGTIRRALASLRRAAQERFHHD